MFKSEQLPEHKNLLKSKEDYISADGAIDRFNFNADIKLYARDQKISIPGALKEFFESSQFTEREKGSFALYTSKSANLVDGAVTLIHALQLTEQSASSYNIMIAYFGSSASDPSVWGLSWNIDTMMNWPQGTIMPESRPQLAKIQKV